MKKHTQNLEREAFLNSKFENEILKYTKILHQINKDSLS